MTYPPYQMKQEEAAKYCNVSVTVFKKNYKPHLKKVEDKRCIYFLRSDIERFIRERFKPKVEEVPANRKAVKQEKLIKEDSFEASLKKFEQA